MGEKSNGDFACCPIVRLRRYRNSKDTVRTTQTRVFPAFERDDFRGREVFPSFYRLCGPGFGKDQRLASIWRELFESFFVAMVGFILTDYYQIWFWEFGERRYA